MFVFPVAYLPLPGFVVPVPVRVNVTALALVPTESVADRVPVAPGLNVC